MLCGMIIRSVFKGLSFGMIIRSVFKSLSLCSHFLHKVTLEGQKPAPRKLAEVMTLVTSI